MPEKRYLFICGCPRSGTTALWRLMIAHPRIVLGVERYVHLAGKKGRISPALFERSKFFDLQPGETFYSDLYEFNSYYSAAEISFNDAAWVGDKIPNLYQDYEGIEANFGGAHILCIVRNVIDVAASYQKRAMDDNDATWKVNRDYKRAIVDWHYSLKSTLDFLSVADRRSSVQVISYEELFLQKSTLDPIFQWLDLSMTDSVREEYRRLLARSDQLNMRRGDALNSSQRQYISLNAPVGLYRQLFERRLTLTRAAFAAAGGSDGLG